MDHNEQKRIEFNSVKVGDRVTCVEWGDTTIVEIKAEFWDKSKNYLLVCHLKDFAYQSHINFGDWVWEQWKKQ